MTRAWSLLLLLGVAACQAAPAPVRPVSRAPARPAQAVPSEVEGAWSFGIAGGRCTARVAHRDMTLGITASAGQPANLSVTAPGRSLPAGRPVRLAFRGDGGSWELPGRTNGRRVASASLPPGEAGHGRLRDLLGGGTLRLRGAGVSAPALVLPDSGVSGRDWYACAARPAESAPPPAAREPGDES
ncbi:hypothetical protein J8J14_14820 [Roseomonas sp. SSH11]|uniref:Lipoprotein n=1 Tax=Pararoseomonas baculiformis TaxID=2820812 RepID=A0ABS4AHP8_9PROT|nr:hypothetical protein [Pararoseomonas baculiformis]MBP0446048.1 hypothetical protein [Pararoseomonas baculiformis]